MNHPIYKISNAKVLSDYNIEITFRDGVKKNINLEPVLHGEMYGELRNKKLFNCVTVDKEVGTIQWPNGADFDPATLRNWEDNVKELTLRAKEWELINHSTD